MKFYRSNWSYLKFQIKKKNNMIMILSKKQKLKKKFIKVKRKNMQMKNLK